MLNCPNTRGEFASDSNCDVTHIMIGHISPLIMLPMAE